MASLADFTPEGRPIVDLAIAQGSAAQGSAAPAGSGVVEFAAQTRMSGIDLTGEDHQIRKGAGSAVAAWLGHRDGGMAATIESIAASGGTPWWWPSGGPAAAGCLA